MKKQIALILVVLFMATIPVSAIAEKNCYHVLSKGYVKLSDWDLGNWEIQDKLKIDIAYDYVKNDEYVECSVVLPQPIDGYFEVKLTDGWHIANALSIEKVGESAYHIKIPTVTLKNFDRYFALDLIFIKKENLE